LTFGVHLFAEDERLAAADDFASSSLAGGALELESDLLGVLGLFAEHGLGLATETSLFAIVAALALSSQGSFARLVLRNLVDVVLFTLLAESILRLRRVHLNKMNKGRVGCVLPS